MLICIWTLGHKHRLSFTSLTSKLKQAVFLFYKEATLKGHGANNMMLKMMPYQ